MVAIAPSYRFSCGICHVNLCNCCNDVRAGRIAKSVVISTIVFRSRLSEDFITTFLSLLSNFNESIKDSSKIKENDRNSHRRCCVKNVFSEISQN